MNRGRCHGTIFDTDADRAMFIELVGECSPPEVAVHAFALMDNHYHLLLEGDPAEVATLMRRLGSRFTQRTNHRHGRDGAIFRGRYHSVPIVGSEHLAIAAWYIHRNPLDRCRPDALASDRWSSMRNYVAGHPNPSWLHTDTILPKGSDPEAYLRFVLFDQPSGVIDETVVEWATSVVLLGVELPLSQQRRVADTVRCLICSRGEPATEAKRLAVYRAEQRLKQQPWIAGVVRDVERMLGVKA